MHEVSVRAIVAPLAFLAFLAACVATLSGDWASLLSWTRVVRRVTELSDA
jgi:hypothetical protein